MELLFISTLFLVIISRARDGVAIEVFNLFLVQKGIEVSGPSEVILILLIFLRSRDNFFCNLEGCPYGGFKFSNATSSGFLIF